MFGVMVCENFIDGHWRKTAKLDNTYCMIGVCLLSSNQMGA